MKNERGNFAEWTQTRETEVLPLLEAAEQGRGSYQAYDEAHHISLLELHMLVRGKEALLDAAPDLLAALEAMRDDWLTAFDTDVAEGNPDAVKILADADAAVAKAKGTT